MAKSFISLLIGFAIDDGYIKSIDDSITKFIPELTKRDKRFEKITIRNLLTMQSGLKYNTSFISLLNIQAPWNDEVVGYYLPNIRKHLLNNIEINSEPGKLFQYNNYNTSYLGLIIERATGKTVSTYLEEKLWSQIMKYNALFSIDSKESGFEYMPSRLIARAIDYARFGRLLLKKGNWNGKQIVSKNWVINSSIEDKSIPRNYYPDWLGDGCTRIYYKYQFWGHTNCDSSFQYFANGNLGQSIYVIPKEDIIIVHCGNSNELFNADDLWHVARCINFNNFNQAIVEIGVKAAIEKYEKEKKDNPNYLPFDENFIRTKGYAYLQTGKLDDAKKLFTLNIETYPKSWKTYHNLGDAYKESGEVNRAIEFYKKSLKLNPNDKSAKEKINHYGLQVYMLDKNS